MSLSKSELLDYLGSNENTPTASVSSRAATPLRSLIRAETPEFGPPTLNGEPLISDPEVELCISGDDDSDWDPEPQQVDESISHLSFDELERYEKKLAKSNDKSRSGQGRMFPHIARHNPLTRGKLGELAKEDVRFTPASALLKYPWKHLPPHLTKLVSREFFSNGKVLENSWDIYYLYPPTQFLNSKALLMLRTEQVETFFANINSQTGHYLEILSDSVEAGFVTDFIDTGSLRPRYLGLSRTPLAFKDLERMVPPDDYIPPGEERGPEYGPGDRSFLAFKKKAEQIQEANRNRMKAQKAQKQAERLKKQSAMGATTHRVQRYLGLRQRTQRPPDEGQEATNAEPPAFSVEAFSPFPFESEPLIISIDCEAWEKDQSCVTEIGIAVLDTRDLNGLAPGSKATKWFPQIKVRHIRIQEYVHLRNGKFVPDHADHFEYGESEFIPLHDIPAVLAKVFRRPVSDSNPELRKVVLLGHDPHQDIAYIRKLGFDILNLEPQVLIDTIDTRHMFQFYRSDGNLACSLGAVMIGLELPAWLLHQAAHDAMFTMHAMLAIAVLSLTEGEEGRRLVRAKMVQEKIEESKERVLLEAEGWEDDGTDGGEGVVPAVEAGKPKRREANGAAGMKHYRAVSSTVARSPRQGAALGRERGPIAQIRDIVRSNARQRDSQSSATQNQVVNEKSQDSKHESQQLLASPSDAHESAPSQDQTQQPPQSNPPNLPHDHSEGTPQQHGQSLPRYRYEDPPEDPDEVKTKPQDQTGNLLKNSAPSQSPTSGSTTPYAPSTDPSISDRSSIHQDRGRGRQQRGGRRDNSGYRTDFPHQPQRHRRHQMERYPPTQQSYHSPQLNYNPPMTMPHPQMIPPLMQNFVPAQTAYTTLPTAYGSPPPPHLPSQPSYGPPPRPQQHFNHQGTHSTFQPLHPPHNPHFNLGNHSTPPGFQAPRDQNSHNQYVPQSFDGAGSVSGSFDGRGRGRGMGRGGGRDRGRGGYVRDGGRGFGNGGDGYTGMGGQGRGWGRGRGRGF